MTATRNASLLGLANLAILALWLLLAAPERVMGLESGAAGFALLVLTAWGAMYFLSKMPLGEIADAASPGEWQAWIGMVFMAVMTAYVLLKSYQLSGTSLLQDADVQAIGRDVVMMIIAWLVVSRVIAMRWKGRVQEDERDREIARVAASWGSGALTFCIIGIAVMLGLSPASKLEWASPLMIAHMLIFSLLWGGLVDYAATAIQYWRDRH